MTTGTEIIEIDENLLGHREVLLALFREVIGGVGPEIVPVLYFLSEQMKRLGVQGHIGEIGVLHGLFLVSMSKLCSPGEKAVAIDVFEQQQFNVDSCGIGLKDIVRSNFEKFGGRDGDLDLIETDSTALHSASRFREFVNKYQEFKIFSVDGCHMKRHTIADITLGSSVLANGGLLIIDDFTNAGWAGVADGTSAYFATHNIRLAPLVVGFNKLVCTTISHHKQYIEAISQWIASFGFHRWYDHYKIVTLYEHDTWHIAQAKGI